MSKRRDVFSAISDGTRRSILELLRGPSTRSVRSASRAAQGERTMTAGEIAANFPRVSRAAVSKHLRVLREARLVRARERGREWHYSLDAQPLAAVYGEWLESFAPQMEESLGRLKRQVEEGG